LNCGQHICGKKRPAIKRPETIKPLICKSISLIFNILNIHPPFESEILYLKITISVGFSNGKKQGQGTSLPAGRQAGCKTA